MKKACVLTMLLGLLPFLLVWVAFIFTGFAFSPKDVFQNGIFWVISCSYWVLPYLCGIVPTIWDNVD